MNAGVAAARNTSTAMGAMPDTWIWITGTSRGLGRAIAEAYLQRPNTRVFGIARSEGPQHERYTHIQLDLSQPEQVLSFEFPELPDGVREVILINNAAALGPVRYVGSLPPEEVAPVIHLNLTAPIILMNAFLRQYGKRPVRRIIANIGTGAALHPVAGWVLYCSSTAGLEMATQVVALEQQRQSLPGETYVAFIVPGIIDTAMQAQIRQADPTHFSRYEEFVQYYRSGQLRPPEEVAERLVHALDRIEEHSDIVIRLY